MRPFPPPVSNRNFHVELPGGDGPLFVCVLNSGNGRLPVFPPVFPIDGGTVHATVTEWQAAGSHRISDAVTEHRFAGPVAGAPGLSLEAAFQIAEDASVLRFRYILHSEAPVRLVKPDGADALTYFRVAFDAFDAPPQRFKEVRFSEFSSLFHTFCPTETPLSISYFADRVRLIGPMLVATEGSGSALVAYEHGSQVPDAFLAFDLEPGGAASLGAVKGNYRDGQTVGPGQPFETPWFQVGVTDGDEDDLARAYREWVLKYQSPNAASRKPYLFYNTWNYQERVKHWQKRPYLADMNEARMLAEIEVAHRMGLDVFVIDTGWYEKTGDWRVSSERFPRGLGPLKAKLDEYGMKLGLWFNPTVAAVSSEMRKNHEDCLMTRNGSPHDPHEVWETEASQGLCLVSRYGDAFADELIRLHREVGVTYFKWDAIGQYGCDAPGHGHGEEHNTPDERRDAYAFLLGRAMTGVVDKVCAACPDAIVDFDITEGGRTVGLQFLSSGKYFLINNGPYNHDYNMPVPADGNVNLFFFPGPARAWICRAPLTYDKWLPSVLFLTHYLPDGAHREGWEGGREVVGENPWIAIASLVLGQNGVWGDLLALSEETVATFGNALGLYRQVADDVTAAHPVRAGQVGGSPEVHEKVNPVNGRGVVCLFASAPGTYPYLTENRVAEGVWHNHGVSVRAAADGRARIEARFGRGEYAKVVFFGVAPPPPAGTG